MPRLAIATAPKRNSYHWAQSEISWDEIQAWLDHPASVKEAGNYLLGTLRETTVVHPGAQASCTELHRRKDAVVSRSAITLDVDHPETTFLGLLELTFPYAAIMHTTYRSAPGEERYRLIIPTDRPMLPDEYVAAATLLMRQLGEAQFDAGSAEPERYMFRPSAQEAAWFGRWVFDGDVCSVDGLLADWEWDLSERPFPRPHHQKRDPYEIDGTIGAFNRAYRDWGLLIDEYELPYERADAGRWHLVGARSVAGMGEIEPGNGLVYSHHAGDPAGGRACSAFDLVRLHRFGELDEGLSSQTPVNRLPSHDAMLELASTDERVVTEIVGADFGDRMDSQLAETDWLRQLRRNRTGTGILDVISNWDLIKQHDPIFQSLRFNTLSYAVEMDPLPPWRDQDERATVGAADRAHVYHYVEREYGLKASRSLLDEHIDTAASSRAYSPVVDFLKDLVWDGTPRLETCLPGVTPTPYTRMVARKSLVAAVARMLNPGCKWDHTLVLYGNEGLGKSYWVDRMSLGYSASLGRISDKDTLLAMQRSWIMVSDEGHSLRKVDADVQKEFLTRTEDVFRLPYEKDTLAHPRHCVIWSTTNDEVFLRRQEGNRRFLIVHCEHRVDFERLTPAYVAQVWAEAVYLYRAGETLFLEDEEAIMAAAEREAYTEEDALAGLITKYADTLKPAEWNEMALESRQLWLRDHEEGLVPEGVLETETLCSAQIWAEALGRRLGEHRRTDLLEIVEAFKRLGYQAAGVQRTPLYGPQKVYRKKNSETG